MLWSVSGTISAAVARRRGVLLLACVLALSACASSIVANVTTYQKWPSDAVGQSYRIVAQADQSQDNLEFQTVADMVRAGIGASGLVEAVQGQDARFSVHMHYENPLTQIWVRRYADVYPYYPWGYPFPGYYGRPFGWGGWYAPPVVTVPVQVHRNTLTLWITDARQQNAEVYRATAIELGESDQWMGVMPYLVRAIFDDFPGNNGQVRRLEYDLPKVQD